MKDGETMKVIGALLLVAAASSLATHAFSRGDGGDPDSSELSDAVNMLAATADNLRAAVEGLREGRRSTTEPVRSDATTAEDAGDGLEKDLERIVDLIGQQATLLERLADAQAGWGAGAVARNQPVDSSAVGNLLGLAKSDRSSAREKLLLMRPHELVAALGLPESIDAQPSGRQYWYYEESGGASSTLRVILHGGYVIDVAYH